jgi:hypothetical protein
MRPLSSRLDLLPMVFLSLGLPVPADRTVAKSQEPDQHHGIDAAMHNSCHGDLPDTLPHPLSGVSHCGSEHVHLGGHAARVKLKQFGHRAARVRDPLAEAVEAITNRSFGLVPFAGLLNPINGTREGRRYSLFPDTFDSQCFTT